MFRSWIRGRGEERHAGQQAHPAHHRRRHRRLQVARPDPAAAGARRAGALHSHRRRAAFRHAARGRRALPASAPTPICSMRRASSTSAISASARDTDLIVVAPATADLMAKMAGGHADDLATAVLLATDKPILLAPAMNPHMWAAKATQRNLAQLHDGRRSHRRAEQRRDGRARRSRRRPHGRADSKSSPPPRRFCAGRACSPASACWSPRGRPASRSIRCASSPTARRASRATPSPPPRPPPAPR